MRTFLTKGLAETDALWADVEMGYRWVHQAAHLLANEEKQNAPQVRQHYEALLAEIGQAPETSETLTIMLATFRKVTASYWPGLFHCYDVADLPRTNNDLEQYFGSAAITSDARREEKQRRRASSFVEQCALWQELPPVSIIFLEQVSNQEISNDGTPCETN